MADRSYFYAVGKRKTAIATVRLFESGSGKVTVNGKPMPSYFFGALTENALAPLETASVKKAEVDIEVRVKGGGKAAQSDAIRLGISRALLLLTPDYRTVLKHAGFLRRDDRIKERKKPGLKKARRAPQFAKR